MEKYRKTVKRRIVIYTIVTIVLLALLIYGIATEKPDSNEGDFVYGFRSGVCTGIILVCVICHIRSCRILRDDKALQLAYNKENDERMKAILTKCGYPICSIMSMLMMIAGIALAEYNVIIFFTAVACGTGQLIICLVLKIIYLKIM